jgi:hypothetical protein
VRSLSLRRHLGGRLSGSAAARTALEGGATVVEVNKDSTPLTGAATFCLLGAAGAILPALLDAAWRT